MENRVYRGEIYYIHETEISGERAGWRKTWNYHQ